MYVTGKFTPYKQISVYGGSCRPHRSAHGAPIEFDILLPKELLYLGLSSPSVRLSWLYAGRHFWRHLDHTKVDVRKESVVWTSVFHNGY